MSLKRPPIITIGVETVGDVLLGALEGLHSLHDGLELLVRLQRAALHLGQRGQIPRHRGRLQRAHGGPGAAGAAWDDADSVGRRAM